MTFRSIVLFAHNEEASILGAIDAVKRANPGPDDRIIVLINGSTDHTLSRVKAASDHDPRIHPIAIALGDKANAWDLYVHILGDPSADIHIFVDGDVRISKGALDEIDRQISAHPEALAISTLPRGGRQSVRWAARIMAHSGMPGNFYAVPGPTFRRLRGRVWLPVGFMGDDTLLRWLLLRNLDPLGDVQMNRIKPCPTVFFDYDSFPRNSIAGLRRLVRRHLQYARREIQVHLLFSLLTAQGLAAMPRRISQVYDRIHVLKDSLNANVGFKGRRLLLPFIALSLKRRKSQPPPNEPVWFEVDAATAKEHGVT